MGFYQDVDAMKSDLAERGGTRSMAMSHLRDACGFQRLGKHVLRSIGEQLRAAGLAHVPRSLPDDQYASVRVYVADSAVGRLIHTALRPGAGEDIVLIETANDEDRATLQKVRALLGA